MPAKKINTAGDREIIETPQSDTQIGPHNLIIDKQTTHDNDKDKLLEENEGGSVRTSITQFPRVNRNNIIAHHQTSPSETIP